MKQVKRDLISSAINFVYELLYESPNDLRLRIIGNQEILGNSQRWLEAEPSAHSLFQKQLRRNRNQSILVLSIFP